MTIKDSDFVIDALCGYYAQVYDVESFEAVRQSLDNDTVFKESILGVLECRFKKIQNSEALSQNQLQAWKRISLALEPNVQVILLKLYQIANAITRTNIFISTEIIVFKFDPSKISGVAKPIPFCEIYVYSNDFEGIHIRGAKIARGGIRISDRKDYRNEVFSLYEAQMLKNTIVVPAGAKGGFFVKNSDNSQDFIVGCYKQFISCLLDMVDNMEYIDSTWKPKGSNIVKYDDVDPYLVVAADKGTGGFSDYANSVAKNRGYWLKDAFASGGSNGYNHKDMAITSAGAYISLLSHLGIEINIENIVSEIEGIHFKQKTTVESNENMRLSVIGIGDMSGDVFGNGILLLGPNIKLIGAFNHSEIFLDPNPKDLVASYNERLRLFNKAGSCWKDYNPQLISEGGGVFQRNHFSQDVLSSNMIKDILSAKVDILWNGGIGCYIKSSLESHDDANDSTNDNVRINADQMGAKIIIEGGNCGITQLGRIELARRGKYLNTDFIDNSGGVSCSDHEVNIKIALLMAHNRITEDYRRDVLKSMKGAVARLVLKDNQSQNNIIASIRDDHKVQDTPLICTYLSRIKVFIRKELEKTEIWKDSHCNHYVNDYFPIEMQNDFKNEILSHPLRMEIINMSIANEVLYYFWKIQDLSDNNLLEGGKEKINKFLEPFTIKTNILGQRSCYLSNLGFGTENTSSYIVGVVRIFLALRFSRDNKHNLRYFLDNIKPKEASSSSGLTDVEYLYNLVAKAMSANFLSIDKDFDNLKNALLLDAK